MEADVASAVPTGAHSRDTSYLSKQDYSKLDLKNLSPITQEIMSRQATLNIGYDIFCIFNSSEFSYLLNADHFDFLCYFFEKPKLYFDSQFG